MRDGALRGLAPHRDQLQYVGRCRTAKERLPRRYFRLSLVLSFRSSFNGGGVRSSTTAQCTLSRRSSISGSCPLLTFERRSWAQWPWACLRPCPAADREAVARRGRAERAGACDAPLPTRPARAVAIPFSFASQGRLSGDGANGRFGPRPGCRRPAAANGAAANAARWRASRNSGRRRGCNSGENSLPSVRRLGLCER